jgi:hypothetical protein
MEEFIIPISPFAAISVIGLIAGGLTFLSSVAVHQKSKYVQNLNKTIIGYSY